MSKSSRKLRKAARGAPCFLNLPGCNPGPENCNVVLCHRRGAGMALKSDDLDAVLGCFNCHSILDGPESAMQSTYDKIFERAKDLTHKYWKRRGLL